MRRFWIGFIAGMLAVLAVEGAVCGKAWYDLEHVRF
jgi:hypothetical protein